MKAMKSQQSIMRQKKMINERSTPGSQHNRDSYLNTDSTGYRRFKEGARETGHWIGKQSSDSMQFTNSAGMAASFDELQKLRPGQEIRVAETSLMQLGTESTKRDIVDTRQSKSEL